MSGYKETDNEAKFSTAMAVASDVNEEYEMLADGGTGSAQK